MTTPAEIFWVIGDNTNVGKTTIACALIRHLNKTGRKAVGFKPVGGVYLYQSMDFLLSSYPKSSCTIYGGNSIKLAMSSPLTNQDMLEALSPLYYLIYPRLPGFVMARAGATMLGNVAYYKPPLLETLRERPDFKHLIEACALPVDEARPLKYDNVTFRRTNPIVCDSCNASLRFLGTLGAEAYVFEGADTFLPVWKGCPMPDHVIYIANGTIGIVPNLAGQPILSTEFTGTPVLRDFMKVIDGQQRRQIRPAVLSRRQRTPGAGLGTDGRDAAGVHSRTFASLRACMRLERSGVGPMMYNVRALWWSG